MALVVFTGGARSGKSSAAQRLAEQRFARGRRVQVVVFGRDDGTDAEFSERVARHREVRPGGFETIESDTSTGWLRDLDADSVVLVDCVGTLLGLAMEEAWPASSATELADAAADALPAGYAERVQERFRGAVDGLVARGGDAIVVTNEVGDGLVPPYAAGRLFRDELGRANRRLVAAADAAYLCVAGRLVPLSGLPLDATWPED